jgi:hypothetical protein
VPSVPALPIVLPEYANIEAAQEITGPFASVSSSTAWTYRTGANYIEVLIGATFSFTTSATAGNRFPAVQLNDQDLGLVYLVSGSNPIPASTTTVTTYSATAPVVVVPGVSSAFYPIPPTAMYPNWLLTLAISGPQAGDSMARPILTLMRFPTNMPSLADLRNAQLNQVTPLQPVAVVAG